jgi:uncharacterized membrane protein YidH (DUF202 family)
MRRPPDAKTGAEPGPATDVRQSDDRLFELERMLMEADRVLMQMVTLSLSLIGFGFSINTFFNDAARLAASRANYEARMFGIFLVLLGLLFLSMGTWTQSSYRHHLMERYGAPPGWRTLFGGRATPAFVTAFLLLAAGFVALGIMLFRRLL